MYLGSKDITSKDREPSRVERTCDNASVISASEQFSVAINRKLLEDNGFIVGGISETRSTEDGSCGVSVVKGAAVQLFLRRCARQRQSLYTPRRHAPIYILQQSA